MPELRSPIHAMRFALARRQAAQNAGRAMGGPLAAGIQRGMDQSDYRENRDDDRVYRSFEAQRGMAAKHLYDSGNSESAMQALGTSTPEDLAQFSGSMGGATPAQRFSEARAAAAERTMPGEDTGITPFEGAGLAEREAGRLQRGEEHESRLALEQRKATYGEKRDQRIAKRYGELDAQRKAQLEEGVRQFDARMENEEFWKSMEADQKDAQLAKAEKHWEARFGLEQAREMRQLFEAKLRSQGLWGPRGRPDRGGYTTRREDAQRILDLEQAALDNSEMGADVDTSRRDAARDDYRGLLEGGHGAYEAERRLLAPGRRKKSDVASGIYGG